MDALIQLGVNATLILQLGLFLFVFAVLKYLLFEPYFAAFNERKERTEGKTELAERFIGEARELEEKFGIKAREANDRFREVFEKSRAEATKEYDQVLSHAREKAKEIIESSRVNVQKEIQVVRGQLSQEVSTVSHLVITKLIGKDLNT